MIVGHVLRDEPDRSTRGPMEFPYMRNAPDRAVFTVLRHQSGWAVEHDGQFSDLTHDKEIAKAAANRRARAAQDAGQLCLVRVVGEHGFFNAA